MNDGMGAFVADATIKELILAGKAPKKSKIVILGLTFKENCPDIRNSKVEDIIKRLKEYGIDPVIVDPWADEKDALKEYDVTLTPLNEVSDSDCIILAVAHDVFKEMSWDNIRGLYDKNIQAKERVLIDVKGIRDKREALQLGYRYWRL